MEAAAPVDPFSSKAAVDGGQKNSGKDAGPVEVRHAQAATFLHFGADAAGLCAAIEPLVCPATHLALSLMLLLPQNSQKARHAVKEAAEGALAAVQPGGEQVGEVWAQMHE
jgi:hypothetical protein